MLLLLMIQDILINTNVRAPNITPEMYYYVHARTAAVELHPADWRPTSYVSIGVAESDPERILIAPIMPSGQIAHEAVFDVYPPTLGRLMSNIPTIVTVAEIHPADFPLPVVKTLQALGAM